MQDNPVKQWEPVYNSVQNTEAERIANSLTKGNVIFNNKVPELNRLEIMREGLKIARGTPQIPDAPKKDLQFSTRSAIVITGTATSKYNQIDQVVNQLENGPYYANGRDNKLTYQNSRARDPIILSYTYNGGNGELLSFEIDTEYTVSIVEATVTSDIDENTKEIKTQVNHVIDNRDWSGNNWSNHIEMPRDNTRTLYPDLINKQFVEAPSDHVYNPSLTEEQIKQSGVKNDLQRRFNSNQALKVSQVYNSEEEAEVAIGKNFVITPGIYEEYIQGLKERHQKINDIKSGQGGEVSSEDFYKYATQDGRIPDYLLKRTVTIEQEVDPLRYLPRGRGSSSVVAGSGLNPSTYKTDKNRATDWKTSYNYLNTTKGVTIVTKSNGRYGGYEVGDKVLIRREVELELPIPGIRILAAHGSSRLQNGMVNDMIRNVQNKVTANARVLGNPLIESSMNIEIKGISNRYSGVWYTKEVVHSFDDTGYYCDIDFIEKNIPILSTKIESNVSTLSNYDSTNGLDAKVKEAMQNKSHLSRAALATAFRESPYYKSDGNYLLLVDPSNPYKADVYWADEDMFGYKENKIGTIEAVPEDRGERDNYGIIPEQ